MKMSQSPKTRANGSTQPRQKSKNSPKRSKPPRHKLRRHKELPLNTCRLPLSKFKLPLNKCSIKEQFNIQAQTGQTGTTHRSDRRPSSWPVRPVPGTGQAGDQQSPENVRNLWKPSKCIQNHFSFTNFSPLLTMQGIKAKFGKIPLGASQIDFEHHKMLQ